MGEADDRAEPDLRARERLPRKPRSHGRTQTVAVPYFFATARPFFTVSTSSSGRSREWSIILAMSLGVSIETASFFLASGGARRPVDREIRRPRALSLPGIEGS